jgi:glutathione peroxidase
MKTILLASLFALFLFEPSVYDFKLNSLEARHQIKLSDYKGKKILIVNTASKSKNAFQFEGLQLLYTSYQEKLVVIGIPCGSDFNDSELKTNSDILYYLQSTYGVTFPMAEMSSAIGTQRHPLFSYLIEEAKKMGIDDPIKTSFTKFLLDENGKLLRVFPGDVTPLSNDLTSVLNNSRGWEL